MKPIITLIHSMFDDSTALVKTWLVSISILILDKMALSINNDVTQLIIDLLTILSLFTASSFTALKFYMTIKNKGKK